MKLIIGLIFIIFSANVFSVTVNTLEESWVTSKKDLPSCALYRKRISNYFQRISELEFADKVTKGKLSEKEIAHLLDVGSRAGVDILPNETVIYKRKMWMGDWSYALNYKSAGYIRVTSPFFNWTSETLTTPEDILRVIPNEKEDNVTIEYSMTLAQACLNSSKLTIMFGLRIKDSEDATVTFDTNLDKYQWDLAHMLTK